MAAVIASPTHPEAVEVVYGDAGSRARPDQQVGFYDG